MGSGNWTFLFQRSLLLFYPPIVSNELCDSAPRELAWKTVLLKRATVKALFDSFFPDLTISLTLNPLPPPLTNLCKSVAHSLLSFPSILPWEGLKASVQRFQWKFCTLSTVSLRWIFEGRLKYFFSHCLSVAFWSADWIWPVTDNRYQIFKEKQCPVSLRLSVFKLHLSLSWGDANFHFDTFTVFWPQQGLVPYVFFELSSCHFFASETELRLLPSIQAPANSLPWDGRLWPSSQRGSMTDESDASSEVLQSSWSMVPC